MPFEFEKLVVYQKALELAKNIYRVTKEFPKDELYSLTSQLRRAVVSIAANIAEGSARYHAGNFIQFLRIARGSAYECIPLLAIAQSGNYLSQETAVNLTEKINEISKMINGLIKSLENKK